MLPADSNRPSENLALNEQDQTFALAVIEYNGNLGAAYRAAFGAEASNPVARARELLCRPDIARYVQRLAEAAEEHALISLGSHLGKLAEIRDLAIASDQYKVALAAEKTRGEAAGFYAPKVKGPAGAPQGGPAVFINIGGPPANVQEWAQKHGRGTVIDVTPK
jgi:hypothetical protein